MIPVLPPTLAPPAPFPLILSQSREEEFVAPGVVRARYRLTTNDGPVVISIVAVDPREPSVRLDSVVAGDKMISRGETLSAMARRTGAIAGVNADYFDIGNTHQPLNLVVRSGSLERTPSKRIVLAVHRDRSVRFERASFSGSVSYGTTAMPLTTVNEWPPQGGAGFLTSAYGMLKAAPGVSIASLVPLAAAHLDAGVNGSYRVASIDQSQAFVADADSATVVGSLLAFGPAALAIAAPPAVGDTVTIAATLTPPLDDLVCAVGGGPLLVADGAVVADPYAPAPEESGIRFPLSGAGTTTSGTLVLASVDGRQNELSIGLTRPEFAAFWLGFGATSAMAFDSGGSSELVARVLGTSEPTVLGSPSDGEERAIADGLFVYSDAPLGPPSRLVVRPQSIVALPSVNVPIALAVTDAAGHALGPAHLAIGDVVASGTVSHRATLRARGLVAGVPIDIVAKPATLAITSDARDPDAGGTVHLEAQAFDARGRAVALGDRVRWSATTGTFIAPGVLRVAAHDARVVAAVAGVRADHVVLVGNRRIPLGIFDDARVLHWQFATVPAGGEGSVAVAKDVLHLAFDFTHGTRIAYANIDTPLPGQPQRFSVDVMGDGSGVGLRAAFVNRFGERRALTLAKTVGWTGWQTVTLELPDDLNPPVRLVSLYAVDGLGLGSAHVAGSLGFRNAAAVIAGTP